MWDNPIWKKRCLGTLPLIASGKEAAVPGISKSQRLIGVIRGAF